ncbi:MAG TPA: hypothetical protein VHT91_42425 [Kofleriaceae bacterium]|nr:hypothetical protein [Kofleriaceae bacterium]
MGATVGAAVVGAGRSPVGWRSPDAHILVVTAAPRFQPRQNNIVEAGLQVCRGLVEQIALGLGDLRVGFRLALAAQRVEDTVGRIARRKLE